MQLQHGRSGWASGHLGENPRLPRLRVRNDLPYFFGGQTTYSLPHATGYYADFGTSRQDPYGFYSNYIITIPRELGGLYLVTSSITYGTTAQVGFCRWYKNGVVFQQVGGVYHDGFAPMYGYGAGLPFAGVENLLPGDTLKCYTYQNSGVAMDILGFAEIVRLGDSVR